MNFRECGECNKCCSGMLIGNSHGNPFGGNRACVFLIDSKCTIYGTRPQSCKDYQCAWSQGLLKEESRPDKCNVLVSVEGKKVQFLKVIYENGVINTNVESEVNEFGEVNNCEVKHVRA